jgi:light-regulated signal transduction histidine kinase (bacteriophytochrome)
VDCNKVLQDVMTDMNLSIKETDAKINFGELPVINGHSELRYLFQNLISNSIKFRKKDLPTVINIAAQDNDTEWIFSVADNGIGIDKNYYDRIFILFQKLHSQKKYTGTGIGLAHCKKIVELHGGKIWVESELQKGSVFYFTIPKNIT